MSEKLKAVGLSEEDFWESENAIVRAQVLQNPILMAAQLELLTQRVTSLETQFTEKVLWRMTMNQRSQKQNEN